MSSLYSRSKDLFLTRKSLTDSQLSPQSSLHSLTTRSFRDRTTRVEAGLGSSSGDSTPDRTLVPSALYTSRKETRLQILNKVPSKTEPQNYKKMYDGALAENEALKFRLDSSKQELSKIQTQLEKVKQMQNRIPENSSFPETEKREKQVLEKKVLEMEKQLRVLTELRLENKRLKDENGALIRVISKLSK